MPEITNEILKELDQIRSQKMRMIQENNEYVKGRNPATLNEAPQSAPDNRVTIPLAKIAVDTLCGYAGRAGDIETFWENIVTVEEESDSKKAAEEDTYIDLQRRIAEYNEAALETSELYQIALPQGVSYELLWVSDALDLPKGVMTPEYKWIPNQEIVLVWSTDIKPTLLAAARFWTVKKNRFVDVYYPEFSNRWEMLKETDDWIRNKEEDTQYPYKKVPLAIYGINRDQDSLFEAEKGLITANDKLLNKSVNEVDRFNALITLLPGKVDKTFVDKLKEIKVLDQLADYDKWPEYLEKNLSGINEFYTALADRLERLFHQSIKIPDFSDENFVNAQSGLAMAYKLLGLEFITSKIEIYFLKGLKMRNELINDVIGLDTSIKTEEYKMVLKPKRNLPTDDKSKAEIAQLLFGILSKETLLRFLPKSIVDDVEKEQARLEKEGKNEAETEDAFNTED